jgi:hypothetical protein
MDFTVAYTFALSVTKGLSGTALANNITNFILYAPVELLL